MGDLGGGDRRARIPFLVELSEKKEEEGERQRERRKTDFAERRRRRGERWWVFSISARGEKNALSESRRGREKIRERAE